MVNSDTLKRTICGSIGTGLSATALSNIEDIQSLDGIISIVCTVLGLFITIISCVVIPLIKWWKKSKEDGKISADEIIEGAETLQKGTEEIKKSLENLKEEGKDVHESDEAK